MERRVAYDCIEELKSPCKTKGRQPYRSATVAGSARTISMMIAQDQNMFNRLEKPGKERSIQMKKTLLIILALVTLFVFSNTAFASGNITGAEYARFGYPNYGWVYAASRSEITTAMSSGGQLYDMTTKAVALDSPGLYCTVDRVRVYPQNYSSDLRIDPNYSSNWVGYGQVNLTKQVKAVQTILVAMGYLGDSTTDWDEVDGNCGTGTIDAIKEFQIVHYLTDDGIVGTNTWRALCSSSSYQYGVFVY